MQVTAQENSLYIELQGTPAILNPGGEITYDIWYDALVNEDWFADHSWLIFWFDPEIEIISAPLSCSVSGVCDFTPGMNGKGWLSELIGGKFVGKINPATIPGSVITTTAEVWNCLEKINGNEFSLSETDDESNRIIVSGSSTSINEVVDPISVPEFPNTIPVIFSSAGLITIILYIKKRQ